MFKRIKLFLSKNRRKFIAFSTVGIMSAFTAISCLAVETVPDTTTFVSGATSIFNELTKSINIGNIVSILIIAIPVCLGLFLFWWGGRKLIRMIMGAFKKGKISV